MSFDGYEGRYVGRIGIAQANPAINPLPPLEVNGRKVLYTAFILAPEYRGRCMPLHPDLNDEIGLLVQQGKLLVAPYGTIVAKLDNHSVSVTGDVYYNERPSGYFMKVERIHG